MIALAAQNHWNAGREAGRCGVMERGNDERGALPVILQHTIECIVCDFLAGGLVGNIYEAMYSTARFQLAFLAQTICNCEVVYFVAIVVNIENRIDDLPVSRH